MGLAFLLVTLVAVLLINCFTLASATGSLVVMALEYACVLFLIEGAFGLTVLFTALVDVVFAVVLTCFKAALGAYCCNHKLSNIFNIDSYFPAK